MEYFNKSSTQMEVFRQLPKMKFLKECGISEKKMNFGIEDTIHLWQ